MAILQKIMSQKSYSVSTFSNKKAYTQESFVTTSQK